jgi:hypothetical protein
MASGNEFGDLSALDHSVLAHLSMPSITAIVVNTGDRCGELPLTLVAIVRVLLVKSRIATVY